MSSAARTARRAKERADRRNGAKRATILGQLEAYAQRAIDLARTKEPRAAADDLYEEARHYRRAAQSARNDGDEATAEHALQQARTLEDAASAFVTPTEPLEGHPA